MTKIYFSPLANDDLQSIKEYISVDLASPKAAIDTVSRITKRIRNLEQMPKIGTPLSAICNVVTDYRFLVCRNYLIFYRYHVDTIYVIRVLYGKRDYLSILFGDSLHDTVQNSYE